MEEESDSKWAERIFFFVMGVLFFMSWLVLGYQFNEWRGTAFLLVPIYGVLGLVLLRVRRGNFYRVGAFVAGMFSTILVLFIVFCLVFFSPDGPHRRLPFDPVAWQTDEVVAAAKRMPSRLEMADDLVSTEILEGLKLEEIQGILGPFDSEKPSPVSGNQTIFYLLDYGGFLQADRYLKIYMNTDGRASSIQIVYE